MAYKISEHFSLSKTERIKSKKTIVYFYTHKKTGAQIIYMKNANENASFGSFFKTPAHNNKGTTHILEHLVFCGSKKYPKGDTFDFLKDNSLASFLNASTYIDATLYHFSSSFEKDFLNVMDMYLDLMYFPILDINMFRREGFFYTKSKDEFNFNGIVFNEMKNNLLTLSSKIFDTTKEMFNPGPYSYESGGEPLDIVDLTIEEIKDYHKKYYHPSNSYTIIFGKINEKKVFEKLNEVYSQFEKSENFDIPKATPTLQNKKLEVKYQTSDKNDNGNFTKYYLFKNISSEEDFITLRSGLSTLFKYDFSPVNKDLQDSKLLVSFDTDLEEINFPVLIVSCQGVKEEDTEKLETLLDTSIKKHIKKIPAEIKEIFLSNVELDFKELEFSLNQGIHEINRIILKWKDDYDPLISLRGLKTLDIYKKVLKGKKLESFMQKVFHESQVLSVRFTPSNEMLEEYNNKIAAKLEEKLKNLTLENLSKDIEDFEKVSKSKEKLVNYSNLKKLSINDLKLKELELPIHEKNSMYYTEVPSVDILRVNLHFDVSQLDPSKFFYLETYLYLLTKTGTKTHNYQEFGKLISRSIPRFYTYSKFFKDLVTENYNFYAIFNLTFLLHEKENVFNLFLELKNEIKFEKDWVLFCLRESLDTIEQNMVQNPEKFGELLSGSLTSPIRYYNYQTESLTYYQKLKSILSDYDENYKNLFEELINIHNFIMSQNCIVYYGTSKNYLEEGKNFLNKLINNTGIKIVTKDKVKKFIYPDYEKEYQNSHDENFYHFVSNSESNYVYVSLKYEDIDKEKRELLPATNFYLTKYLWDTIRKKGKAYGSKMNYSYNSNSSYFYSYRDPNIDFTIETFNNYHKNYDVSKLSKKEYEKLKLKELSKLKTILTNRFLYNQTINNFLSSNNFEYRTRIINKLKSLNFEEYKDLFNHLKKVIKKFVVVVATEKNLKKSKYKYKTLGLN